MSVTPTSSYCFLRPGKPDNRQRRPEGDDTRQWIAQPPQKENTCWYYGLKMIREHFGKDPHPIFLEGRKLEKYASSRRKLQTTLEKEYAKKLALVEQLTNDPNYTNKQLTTLVGAKAYLPNIARLLTHPSPEVQHEAEFLHGILQPFCAQDKFEDLLLYLNDTNYTQRNKINCAFLKVLSIDPQELYAIDREQRKDRKPWDSLNAFEKASYLDSFAFRASYQKCYHLPESAWHPSQPIADLIAQIEAHGPHYVKGMFGKIFYKTPPVAMKEKVDERTIWFWPPSAERKELAKSHSIVIVGAKEGGSKGGLVFFVDPLDGSNPADPEQQKIYAMSYNRLQTSIVNLHQEKFLVEAGSIAPAYSEDVGYALIRHP